MSVYQDAWGERGLSEASVRYDGNRLCRDVFIDCDNFFDCNSCTIMDNMMLFYKYLICNFIRNFVIQKPMLMIHL